MTITNLRMIWRSDRKRKCNLSIGLSLFLSINVKTATSRLRGHTKALYILTRFNGSRFEFIFTNLVKDSPRLFTSVQAVSRAYDLTRLYRDVKIRSAIVDNHELSMLDDEQVLNKFHGVWNLSDDRGCVFHLHERRAREGRLGRGSGWKCYRGLKCTSCSRA